MPRVIDVIEAPNQGPKEMVVRVPEYGAGDFRLGSQVIVRESQTAVFFRDGKALDAFGPGRHTITTANVPILSGLLGLLTSGKDIFTAEVYFVNRIDFLDNKWGTPEPIALRDPDLGLARLRAFGSYSMAIEDPQMFVAKIVGTQGMYQTSQIQNFLRGIIISKLTDVLGESKKGLFDLPAMFDEISAAVRVKVMDDFKLLGVVIKQFVIESISPTEETQQAIDKRGAMGAVGAQSFIEYQTGMAIGDIGAGAAQGGSGGGSMAETGVGLGAGMGMGTAMAQAMAQSMQPKQAAAPAAATPANPTSPAEVQALLDNLDTRLANGEISEGTYNKLYEKWEARLKEMGG
ncbi:MAG: SPFH domain-containing protein [Anaerolineae bacterium]|nr:SPFH domain-containing protein [Anaerolineae bacterium]MCB9133086.1 SPFH domain-containing protein [Anaerolineales bacterium]MCB0230897.1 SPFH domain-containing protein [Anaerolineae bacterium]MCB0236145.1 SPFH domain-containing protein [Anaerolineae bacterium]MCB0243353.1 SPFH domain-containing protein [Anaerolineae bacterium]